MTYNTIPKKNSNPERRLKAKNLLYANLPDSPHLKKENRTEAENFFLDNASKYEGIISNTAEVNHNKLVKISKQNET